MKIAIPSAGQKLKDTVNPSFGRAANFIIVDSETMEFKIVENPGAIAQGGAGPKAAQCVVDSKAEVVITFECGENAARVLQAAGIKMMKAVSGSLLDVIDKYKKGELGELTEIHAGYHHHGGNR